MPQPHQVIPHFLVTSDFIGIMDQVPYLPGFAHLQPGQQANVEQFNRFRKALVKTITIFRERRKARNLLNSLFHRRRLEKWVARFAPLSSNLNDALYPLIKNVCYAFEWPYAELWHLSDLPGSRRINIVKTFSFVYDRWPQMEPIFSRLEEHMKTRTITLPSRELPGDVFTSHRTSWAVECIVNSADAQRACLMKQVSIQKAFAVPLKGEERGSVTQAIVFYGRHPEGFSTEGARRFVEHGIKYITWCYRKVEVIEEDIKDEVKEEIEEGTELKRGVTSEGFRKRVRRSHSCLRTIRNV